MIINIKMKYYKLNMINEGIKTLAWPKTALFTLIENHLTNNYDTKTNFIRKRITLIFYTFFLKANHFLLYHKSRINMEYVAD